MKTMKQKAIEERGKFSLAEEIAYEIGYRDGCRALKKDKR